MSDGNYLYRESADSWWRAMTVRNGRATAGWLSGEHDAARFSGVGELRGPLAADDPDFREAAADPMGRLLRKK